MKGKQVVAGKANQSGRGTMSQAQQSFSPPINRQTSSASSTSSPLSKYQSQQARQEQEVMRARLPKTRPQEAFYKRLNDIEKKAKTLDQEREDQMDSYDINDFFSEKKEDNNMISPGLQKQITYQENSMSMDQSSSRTIHNNLNQPKMPNLPSDFNDNDLQLEFKYMSYILTAQANQNPNQSFEAQNPFTNKEKMKDENNIIYIAPEANVNDDVLHYYGIKQTLKDTMLDGSKGLRGLMSKNNQFKAIVDDFFERLDSRGKRIKIRRVHVLQEVLGEIGYPYSTMNFHPLTYISQHDLKARANSLAYAKYKLIKRENARKMAKKKLLLIMTVVKCKAFVNKLKQKVAQRREEKRKQDEEQKLRENRRKRLKDSQKLDKSSQDESISQSISQTYTNLIPSESEQSLQRFNSQMNSSSNFGALKKNESNLRRGSINPMGQLGQAQQVLGVPIPENNLLQTSPSFSSQQFREVSVSAKNKAERDDYLAAKIKIEKLL